MPQLGLGLGLHKGGYRGDAYNDLVKLSTWFIDPARPDLQVFPKLEPRTLPNGVSNGEYLQNVSGDVVLQASQVASVVNRANYTQAFMQFQTIFIPPTVPFVDAIQGVITVNGWSEKTSSLTGNYVPNLFSTRSDGNFVFDLPLGTTLAQAQALLAGTVIRYQLATPIDTLNTPIKNPILDRKGNANVTMTNVAWTNLDGYKVETINGKTNVFFNLDGVDTFGAVNSASAPNPTGSDDFWQLCVFRPDDTANRYFGLSRNGADVTTVQYGLVTGATVNPIIDGVQSATTFTSSGLSYVLFGRLNGNRFVVGNGTEFQNIIFGNLIVSRPNTQLASRSNSADGLTKSTFGKGLQGICAMQVAPQGTIDKDKVVSTVAKAMKQIYGLGV